MDRLELPQSLPTDTPVLAVAISPAFDRDHSCYAVSPAGLFRSVDGGVTWMPVIQEVTNASVFSVALSPDYATDRCLFAGLSGGILRSWDAGSTWAISVLPSPPPTVSALAVSPTFAADGVVVAGTAGDGVFVSTDRGATWNPWNFGLLDHNVLSIEISPGYASDETLFLGTGTGLFRSTNRGRAWVEVDLPTGHSPVLSLAISPTFGTDGLIFAGLEADGLVVSRDAGQSWSRAGCLLGEGCLDGSINAISLAPTFSDDGRLLVGIDSGVYYSSDRGQVWNKWAPATGVLGLAVPPTWAVEDQVLVALVEGGVRWLAKE